DGLEGLRAVDRSCITQVRKHAATESLATVTRAAEAPVDFLAMSNDFTRTEGRWRIQHGLGNWSGRGELRATAQLVDEQARVVRRPVVAAQASTGDHRDVLLAIDSERGRPREHPGLRVLSPQTLAGVRAVGSEFLRLGVAGKHQAACRRERAAAAAILEGYAPDLLRIHRVPGEQKALVQMQGIRRARQLRPARKADRQLL